MNVERTGDSDYLRTIDGMIERRERLAQTGGWPRHLVPTRRERELNARLFAKTTVCGFAMSALRKIELSWDTPPVFVAHPEMERFPMRL